jgi:hypothetical protein
LRQNVTLKTMSKIFKLNQGNIDDDYLEDSDIDEGDDGADMKEVRDFDNMVAAGANTASSYQAALAKREGIAQEMWTAYRQARAARGDPIPLYTLLDDPDLIERSFIYDLK